MCLGGICKMAKKSQKKLSNKGFTLIEVLASIILISIILLSFAQIFMQSNKFMHRNNEQLVVINLADAVVEKLKSFPQEKNNSGKFFANYDKKIRMNDNDYDVAIVATQNKFAHKNATYSEQDLGLIKVVVTITAPNGQTKGVSEGYVALQHEAR